MEVPGCYLVLKELLVLEIFVNLVLKEWLEIAVNLSCLERMAVGEPLAFCIQC